MSRTQPIISRLCSVSCKFSGQRDKSSDERDLLYGSDQRQHHVHECALLQSCNRGVHKSGYHITAVHTVRGHSICTVTRVGTLLIMWIRRDICP